MKPILIYVITNGVNGKQYVGITSRDLTTRWKGHLKAADRRSNALMSKAINLHGQHAFAMEHVASAVDWAAACAVETALIEQFKTYCADGGYNLTRGGDGAHGAFVSEETRRKRSVAMKGRVFSDEHRAALKEAAKTAAPRKKMPDGYVSPLRGRKKSAEATEKMRAKLKGRKHDPQRVSRRAANNTGKKRSAEFRQRMSARKASPETRAKISASTKAYYAENPISPERMAAARAAWDGKFTDEGLWRLRAAHLGKKKSAADRAKMSWGRAVARAKRAEMESFHKNAALNILGFLGMGC